MAREPLEKNNSYWMAGCCLAVILALYTVGLVTGLILRHLVQTAPLWIGMILGFRKIEIAKWVVMPFFAFWFCIMTLIWLFLLGWAHIVSGHFSPIEIAMTLIVGVASMVGFVIGLRTRTTTNALAAVAVFLLSFAVQAAAFVASFRPSIAHR